MEKLFLDDDVSLCYSLDDRIIIGGIKPVSKEVKLEGHDFIKADYFLQRRELGVFNIGDQEGSQLMGKYIPFKIVIVYI